MIKMNGLKLCKDCQYMKIPETGIKWARCNKDNKINMVTGNALDIEDLPYCKVQRESKSLQDCGAVAQYFYEIKGDEK